ncbi:related to small nuclear ribonucleoprotein sm d3 [Sporisorium scitamineum]|uniref:Related to small nuclear ribonucleoprotein sm d3 n=1 Tax=Sporisorium scitamineum TaxID=49012 RepID=A0A127Z5H9_9BASI|nr:related to small nuclear ribonucleoprotein sm d3 [Sporisorium scitamineum]
MLFFARKVWLLLAIVALASLVFGLRQAPQSHQATYKTLRPRGYNAQRGSNSAAALQYEATSHSKQNIFWQHTRVPLEVMTHLVHDLHGIDKVVSMFSSQRVHHVVDAKFQEMLQSPGQLFARFNYHGTTFFFTKVNEHGQSQYAKWTKLMHLAPGSSPLKGSPFFIGKLREAGSGSTKPEAEWIIAAAPATKDEESHLEQLYTGGLRPNWMITFDEMIAELPR